MLASQSTQTLTKLFKPQQLALHPVELITYEVDAGFDRGKPDGVFFPESAADVSRIMQWATATKTPLVARGAGTGLSGGAVAEHGGIILEFARMKRILALDPVYRSAIVEPGVVNLALDGEAKKLGLYFPPDPSSQRSSVLGGNIGENSGGPHCFKYGVTTNYVTGLEVVLADGQIYQLGGEAFDYPGYDFCGALVGSEGTLAVFTKAYVRLMRNPPGVKTLMVAFPSIETAGEAVSQVIAAGLVPATLEMMDKKVMGMIEAYAAAGLPVDAEAGLIVEVDGYPAGLDSQMEEVADILTRHGGYNLRIAASEEERQKIWYGRKSAAGAFSRLSPNFYLVDVTVPRSRLADMLAAVNAVCDRYGLQTGHVFHAGDGNLHPAILCDARDPELMRRVFAACDAIIDLCVERNGSITGEHGVGIEKRRYMSVMYTPAELSAMRDLKQLFDPAGLLNPGKIFPDAQPQLAPVTPVLPTTQPFAPTTAQEAAAGLAALTAARQRVTITSQAATHREDPVLTTRNLSGITAFAPADLYVTVGAGTPVHELQAFLAEKQMQTALVSPWPTATVGDLLAANVNAPLRLRYGSLRDNLLSTTVALADGRVIQTGRVVVKNVAGYDLTKLQIGAYGTLGLMTDATLKLYGLPRARQTMAIGASDLAQAFAFARAITPHLLVSAGLVIVPSHAITAAVSAPYALVVTLEGIAEDVTSELADLTAQLATLHAPPPLPLAEQTSSSVWAATLAQADDAAFLLRVGVPPQALAAYCQALTPHLAAVSHWISDPVHGLLYLITQPSAPATAHAWLTAVRELAHQAAGYATVMQQPTAYAPDPRRWDQPGPVTKLMQQLRQCWDPQGILNPSYFA